MCEWKAIQEYYVNNAPDTLRFSEGNELLPLQQFTASVFTLPISGNTLITMIKYDPVNKNFFTGTRKGRLFQLNQSFALKDSFQLKGPPSDIILHNTEKPILSCMGIMDPNDQAVGSIIQLTSAAENPVTLIDSLKRPVNVQKADLNNDGQEDLVVCPTPYLPQT